MIASGARSLVVIGSLVALGTAAIPYAKLLIIVPTTNKELVLHRFNADEALEKSDLDYLFVTSQPLRTVKKGEAWIYQLTVMSKKGGVKYKLESGPPGMAISREGRLSWTAAGSVERENSVIISVVDAAGQECFHTFKIIVEN